MAKSMHDVSDPRNASILINVNGELKPRAEAVVSVFDSGFMLGDGVWEGLRVHKGKLAFLDRHLDRLFEGAKAIAMDVGLSREELTRRLYATLDANGMSEGVHVRLMVTRGVRSTPYQDPRVVVGGATVVIVPEYKEPDPAIYERGLKLFTVHVRRGDPAVQDQKINSHSKLNCILASIQATQAGADEALMLDPLGLRRDLQLDALLHRAQGRGVDLQRQILPRRNHPRTGAGGGARCRHSGGRKGFFADRRLRRRRGVRDRHLRRHRPGPRDRRAQAHLPRSDGRAAAETLRRPGRARRGGAAASVTVARVNFPLPRGEGAGGGGSDASGNAQKSNTLTLALSLQGEGK